MRNRDRLKTQNAAFEILLVHEQPFHTLDALALVPVMRTEVCLEPAQATSEIRQRTFDAILVNVDSQNSALIHSLRQAAPATPIIGVASRADEATVLELANGPLDDYLLAEPSNETTRLSSTREDLAETIVHCCRVATRLRATASSLNDQIAINSQLKRESQQFDLSLRALGAMIEARPTRPVNNDNEELRLIREIQQSIQRAMQQAASHVARVTQNDSTVAVPCEEATPIMNADAQSSRTSLPASSTSTGTAH